MVIICAYADYEEKELASFKPRLVYVDAQNRITHTRNAIPIQVA
ncbi:MAG: aspartate 1-decarboxylase [Gammaproteobacteria bacterium]